MGEKSKATIGNRVSVASMGTGYSTYGPNPTHKESLAIANKQLSELKEGLKQIIEVEIPVLEQGLKACKAPYVKGMD